MRHVSRTHRVAIDWLFDRINLDPKIQTRYIDTKNQLADMLAKGNFTRDEWNHLLCLFNISHFSSAVCSDAMTKRLQQDSGEERVTAKSRPMMSLIQGRPRTHHPRRQKARGREVMEIKILDRGDLISAQTNSKLPTTMTVSNLWKASFAARYSKWDVHQAWSSQEWKTDTWMCYRSGIPL